VKRLRKSISIPIVASNRINTPELAEGLLADEACDFVSMARPMLADPDFVRKAKQNRAGEINTCIACNQACLDFIFSDRIATCLVNPIAGHEIDFAQKPRGAPRRVAVVGSGPAGLSAAAAAASRGHRVVLFEEQNELGGQIHLARRIPTKGEFDEMLRHFTRQIERLKVEVRLGVRATVDELVRGRFDDVVVATGITARRPSIEGIDRPNVVGYADVILGRVEVGRRVAIIGTGGIGHDVAEFLTHNESHADPVQAFLDEYGVDPAISSRGGLKPPLPPSSPRQVTLFQRRRERPGSRLGVSTGWILRNHLRAKGVEIIAGVTYDRISERGLHYSIDGAPKLLGVDHVVICAGQEPNVLLANELSARGLSVRLIGGAVRAEELDALRAIREGVELAYSL
jgi:2,4-dienoyl-CoA reductase (NADPH2)